MINSVNKGLIIGNILLFMHSNMNGYAFYAHGRGCQQPQKYASRCPFSPLETAAGNIIHPGCMTTQVSRRNQPRRAAYDIQIYAMKLQREKEGEWSKSITAASRAGK
ncbi:hypothetical protein SJS82_04810 [Aeromonas media]|uniref:Uncharacterized protein n=1 Tax=Aeromonas media TaxID=651 RepID=A0AAP6L2F8_AERME|nr:hypothetical protein [Aeromonas media]MDX7921248.1 hypothetical protein [Aeromonas media]